MDYNGQGLMDNFFMDQKKWTLLVSINPSP